VFQAGARDLAFVVKVLRSDEADDAVNQKWIERPRDAVCASFERQLVDAVVGVGRQSAALPRFEIHYVVADPGHVPLPVMFEHALAAFTELRQTNAKTGVGGLR